MDEKHEMKQPADLNASQHRSREPQAENSGAGILLKTLEKANHEHREQEGHHDHEEHHDYSHHHEHQDHLQHHEHHDHHSGISCGCGHCHEEEEGEEENRSVRIGRLITAAALMVIGFFFPQGSFLRMLLSLLSA